MSKAVDVEIKGNIAWLTVDNPPVNATNTAVRAGLLEAVSQIEGCALAVLQCAGKTFIAGGDMSEFDAPPALPHLPDVVDAIEKSAVPFVAFMQGNVLGGGFEIAMACAFRVARPGTRFGLPEVNVGLIPGAGGTQRAPRLLGWDMAVDMACFGKMISAEVLFDIGALDAISDDLVSALEGFQTATTSSVSLKQIAAPDDKTVQSYRSKIAKVSRGRKAPSLNLEALLWASEPYQIGQLKERALHLNLRHSDESRALRHLFFAERAATRSKHLKAATPTPLDHIAIVGGGLMGSGIAAACLNGGYKVAVIEQDNKAATAARANITRLMQGALDRGKITSAQYDARLVACTTTSDYSDAINADLAIEAVFEDLTAKRSVFDALSKVMRPDAILATNTSYLNPNEIFATTPGRDRCVGIHFFSPAHIMKLVEVIKTDHTKDSVLATAFGLARKLRKTPVLAGVCDGFIGNRILAAYRRAAEYLLADGALPHEVDDAMRSFEMAMGPFEAQDQAGLQIAQANRRRQDAQRSKHSFWPRWPTKAPKSWRKGLQTMMPQSMW